MAAADGFFHWPSALAALAGGVFIQVATNYTNDYSDYRKGADSHGRLGPTRVTQAGLVTPTAMKQAIVLVWFLAVLAGVYLVWRGGWPILIVGAASILFGILYTAGPYPLGYNGLGDIFVLIFFGPVAVGGTYYVQALSIDPVVVIIGLAPGLYSVAILTVNNLRDIKGDALAGKRTLAVRLGPGFARMEYVACIAIASLLPAALVWTTGQHPWSLISLAALVPAVPVFKTVLSKAEGTILNNTLAATGRLLLFFSLLFSIGWLL
jgi:1,4-dihydroxy-2-naphthoate octaprenyltransferase